MARSFCCFTLEFRTNGSVHMRQHCANTFYVRSLIIIAVKLWRRFTGIVHNAARQLGRIPNVLTDISRESRNKCCRQEGSKEKEQSHAVKRIGHHGSIKIRFSGLSKPLIGFAGSVSTEYASSSDDRKDVPSDHTDHMKPFYQLASSVDAYRVFRHVHGSSGSKSLTLKRALIEHEKHNVSAWKGKRVKE